MALSQWGRWDDEFDDVSLALLVRAYTRRTAWEARVLAGALYGETGEREQAASGAMVTGASGRRYRRVSSDALLARMGAQPAAAVQRA